MSTPAPPRISTPSMPSNSATAEPQRPQPTALQTPEGDANNSNATLRPSATIPQAIPKKKRNHRGGKKKRARKHSFAVSTEDGSGMLDTTDSRRRGAAESAVRNSFYRLQGGNLSSTSVESEALLDHRYVSRLTLCYVSLMYHLPGNNKACDPEDPLQSLKVSVVEYMAAQPHTDRSTRILLHLPILPFADQELSRTKAMRRMIWSKMRGRLSYLPLLGRKPLDRVLDTEDTARTPN